MASPGVLPDDQLVNVPLRASMDIYQLLTVLTCVTSTVTMVLVSVAVLPHVKNGMVLIRDAILWVTFVIVVAGAGWLGGQRLYERFLSTRSAAEDGMEGTGVRTAAWTTTNAPDAYYREGP